MMANTMTNEVSSATKSVGAPRSASGRSVPGQDASAVIAGDGFDATLQDLANSQDSNLDGTLALVVNLAQTGEPVAATVAALEPGPARRA